MWEVEQELLDDDDLFNPARNANRETSSGFHMRSMNLLERLRADYRTQRYSAGPHLMKLMRKQLPDVWRAKDVARAAHGETITIAGAVVCRQRPGTAKGFVFISLEDEIGISNAVASKELFEAERLVITQESYLVITGIVQTEKGLPIVRANQVTRLSCSAFERAQSHDFH